MSSKMTQLRMFRYHTAFDTQCFTSSKFFLVLDRKFTVRTIHHVSTFWKYSSRPWRFQWPVSRKAVLFHEFISSVNSTNYSSYRVELDNHPDNFLVHGDNMYLNAFNRMISFLVRDFCCWTTYQPLFVVDRFCACLYVDRFIHLFPFIKEQSMFIRVNRIFNSAFQISITQI